MEKRLKILELVEDWLPIHGGVTNVVYRMSKILSRYADITVGAVRAQKVDGKDYVDEKEPFSVIRCKGYYNPITTNRESLLMFDNDFKQKIKEGNFDIIHCHFPMALFGYAKKIGKKGGIPVVITAHSIFYEDIVKAIKLKNASKLVTRHIVGRINSADSIWVVTSYAKNYLLNYGLRDDSIVVENAIETPVIQEEINVREKYGIAKDDFVLLSVSRLVKMKNIDLIVKAMAKMKGKNIKLVIIGDGMEREHLHKLAQSTNPDNILFLGAVDENIKNNFYKAADLIIFVSVGDSAGLIQVEAAYFEKPTLALADTAISEKMTDNKNGFVIQNDVDACAEKVLFCYNNRDMVRAVGVEAKKDLYRTYEDDNIAKAILNQYKQAIEDFQVKGKSKN